MKEMEQIPWLEALRKIDYKFDSIHACSIESINTEFGKLKFIWDGSKNKIKVSFINTCSICLCQNPTIVSCNCDWIAFQEGPSYPFKIFTKQQVENLLQPTLF